MFLLENMKGITKILLMLSLFLSCSKIAIAQLVSDSYCKEIENAVATPLNPVHWYHNIVFKDECWLAFDIDVKGGVGLSFKLDKSETEKAARESLHSDIEMYKNAGILDRGKEYSVFKFGKHNFWNEAYFFESYRPLLLRKGRTFITIFCDEKELCSQIEKSLREVPALREY